jgi:hypothetical protein
MSKAAGTVLVFACLAVGACSGRGGEDDAPTTAVATRDPAATFAPLVRLHPREATFPGRAAKFVAHAGLEWAGGRCGYERDLTPSGTVGPSPPSPLPPLVAWRLGHGRGYTAFRTRADCRTPRPGLYSTVQLTRPFDTEDRPVGLPVDEGFNLDIVSAILDGEDRRNADGSLADAPTYYAIERAGQAGIRISYWMVFGRQQPPPDSDDGGREGDWERVDVITRPGHRPGTHVPLTVEYHDADRRTRHVAWSDVELAAGTHPVVYLDRGMHTPRPKRTCRGCTDWRTWERLRDVRRERWYGYGGGWGGYGPGDQRSGPSGPSPFEIGPRP